LILTGRPRADQGNIAILGDDGRGRSWSAGQPLSWSFGEALGEAAAEFATESGAVDRGEKTHHAEILCIYSPVSNSFIA